MSRADLNALIARVEAATAETQHDVLADVIMEMRDARAIPGAVAFRALRMIGAEAYESAAVALVPEGRGEGAFSVSRNSFRSCNAQVWHDALFNRYCHGGGRYGAATPALALTAAALRARLAQMGDDA